MVSINTTILNQTAKKLGPYNVTAYHLATPNNGRLAVTHLPAPLSHNEKKPSIIMMPGMFSNRRFWLSDKGIGFAAYLHQHNYGCWMIDRRGLGESGRDTSNQNSLQNAFQHDIPAVQTLQYQHDGMPAFYMGHSFGGVLNGVSLAHGHLNADYVAGLVNFSSQLTVGKTLLNKPYSALVYLVTSLLGHFPSRALGMGPENESKAVMQDCCRLVDWAKGEKQQEFWQGFHHIQCPVLGIGSDGDNIDPVAGCEAFIASMGSANKTFFALGKQHGHEKDYSHVDMVISKSAQQEVWPMVVDWLNKNKE